jgi:hypothetical protein
MGSRWSRAVVRATAIGLLVAGLVAGLHLDRRGTGTPTAAEFVALPDDKDLQLLKARQNEYAAARSVRRAAESEAAATHAAHALRAATKAQRKEKAAIAEAAKDKAKAGATYAGPIPSSCKEYSGNRATGCALMLAAGFGIDQFPCLEKLWDHESGWNHRAENRNSGAYGIPQAYPGSKMASVGADWRTNPATQIKWGLGYVKGRYDTPCGAWSNFQNNGSY